MDGAGLFLPLGAEAQGGASVGEAHALILSFPFHEEVVAAVGAAGLSVVAQDKVGFGLIGELFHGLSVDFTHAPVCSEKRGGSVVFRGTYAAFLDEEHVGGFQRAFLNAAFQYHGGVAVLLHDVAELAVPLAGRQNGDVSLGIAFGEHGPAALISDFPFNEKAPGGPGKIRGLKLHPLGGETAQKKSAPGLARGGHGLERPPRDFYGAVPVLFHPGAHVLITVAVLGEQGEAPFFQIKVYGAFLAGNVQRALVADRRFQRRKLIFARHGAVEQNAGFTGRRDVFIGLRGKERFPAAEHGGGKAQTGWRGLFQIIDAEADFSAP